MVQGVANTLYAVAKLGSTDGRLITGLTLAVDRLAPHMDAQHLSNTLWALAALDVALPDTLAAVLAQLSERQSNAMDISAAIWALARLHCAPTADLQARVAVAVHVPTMPRVLCYSAAAVSPHGSCTMCGCRCTE